VENDKTISGEVIPCDESTLQDSNNCNRKNDERKRVGFQMDTTPTRWSYADVVKKNIT